MHEGERGGKVAGGDTGTTHRFAWREMEVEAAGRGYIRARLIVSFDGAATTARKSGGDSSGARSLTGGVGTEVKETTGWQQLAEGPYLRLSRRGCAKTGFRIGRGSQFRWVGGGGSGGSRWWVDIRARLMISFAGAATKARKRGGDSSGALSSTGWVEAGWRWEWRRQQVDDN